MLGIFRRKSGSAQLERAIAMFKLADDGLGEAIKQLHEERMANHSRRDAEHDAVHKELAAADAEYRRRIEAAEKLKAESITRHATADTQLLAHQERAERVSMRIKGLLA